MYTLIYLGKEVLKENELGEKNKALEFSQTSFFCLEKSVRASEFYQAMSTGLKPEKVISMNKYEYYLYMKCAIKKVAKVQHTITDELIEYTILREFEVDSDNIELTLTRGVENVGA